MAEVIILETLLINNEDESLAISTLNKFLEERIFDKHKKEICLVFSKKPTAEFFKIVLLAFYDYKSAYLKMVKYEMTPKCNLKKTMIHAGENVVYEQPQIIVGNIHLGANLYIKSNLVVIGEVSGNIYLIDEKSSIYADKFINAVFVNKNGDKKIINDFNRLINYDEMGAW